MDTTLGGRRCRSFLTAADPRVPAPPAPGRPPAVIGFIDAAVYPALLQLCCVGMTLANSIDIAREIQNAGQMNLTVQIMLKLALTGVGLAVGLWGFFFRRDLRRMAGSLPGMLILSLIIWHFVSTPFAISPAKAFVTALSFLAVAGVIGGMMVESGFRGVTIATLIGLVLYAIGSLGLYAAAPELAMFEEVLNSVVRVERFGGLSHPNVTAMHAVLTALIAAGGFAQGYLGWRSLLPILILSVVVLVATKSRTPAIAGVAAATVMSLPLLRFRQSYAVAVIAGVAAILTYLAIEASIGTDFLTEGIFRSFTKTGSAEELTTFTGRTEIWAYSIERTAERPLFGWGIGSTPEVMQEHSGHSHNILLHPLLGFGVPGGLLVVALLLLNVVAAYSCNNAVVGGVVVFLLVSGIAESALLGPFPGSPTMLWLAIALLPVAEQITGPADRSVNGH